MERPSKEQIQDAEPVATITDGEGNQQTVKMLDPSFPENSARRERCMEHIREGVAAELQNDFMIGGYDFRHGGDIVVQLACNGLGCFARRRNAPCAMEMTQYDENGEVVTTMKGSYEV